MRTLSVWNPWSAIPRWMDWDEEGLADMGDIRMDIYEEGDSIMVKLVAPGFKKEDLDISVESGKITVIGKAEQQVEEREKNRKYYRKEITQRSFTRTCALPIEVVSDRAKAEFKDGVLTVSLPKSEAAKPKKIRLDVA